MNGERHIMLTLIRRKHEKLLISDKANFRQRVISDKQRHYIMIKGSIIQEDITILNVYAPNNGAFKVHEAKTDGPERRNR